MKIKNTTTGEIETLIYAPNGCDCLPDLTADDANIVYNSDTHEASGDAIGWWKTWIREQEELDALCSTARKELSGDEFAEIQKALDEAQNCDMEDQPKAGKAALMQWMEENGYHLKTYSDGFRRFLLI